MHLCNLALARSFRDRERSETVCLVSHIELLDLACSLGNAVPVCAVFELEHDEIVIDSLSEGVFSTMIWKTVGEGWRRLMR